MLILCTQPKKLQYLCPQPHIQWLWTLNRESKRWTDADWKCGACSFGWCSVQLTWRWRTDCTPTGAKACLACFGLCSVQRNYERALPAAARLALRNLTSKPLRLHAASACTLTAHRTSCVLTIRRQRLAAPPDQQPSVARHFNGEFWKCTTDFLFRFAWRVIVTQRQHFLTRIKTNCRTAHAM